MIKAKSNRKARRLFGMPHWKSNKFKVAISETAAGEKWKVVKKKK
ncbi:stationary-phase-induced ribosome-associated protein [Serratia marcescens]